MEKQTTKTEKDKQPVWMIILWLLPAIVLPQIAEDVNGGIPVIAMSMVLGAIGSIIGFGFYWVFKDRSKGIQIGAFLTMLVLLFGVVAYFANASDSQKEGLLTCQICGYQTLAFLSDECVLCGNSIHKDFIKREGYPSKEEMILAEQVYFFGFEEELTFETPEIFEDGPKTYTKDKNWIPVASWEAVLKEREN